MSTPATRRWPRRVIGILIAAVVVFYVGGGLVFANKFRADALTPSPPTHDFGVWVTALDEGTVTISAPEERQDIGHPGVLGVYWEGGYGQIGEVQRQSATSVTRSFTLVSGEPPSICLAPDFAGCEPVDLEGWAFENDPSDVGLDFDEVTYQAPLGEFGAWLVPADDADTWVIHVHGWRAARRETVRTLPTYHHAGITSLVIDYRNDPGAPPDPTGHYRFGVTEWEEVDAAVRHAREQGANRVMLAAYSTGASGVMAFMERSDQADDVAAIILDAPNIDMSATVHNAAAEMDLPAVGVKVPRSLTSVAMTIAGIRWDVDWDAINYLGRADRLTVPVLVFHGEEDNRVPIEVSRSLQAKNPERVHLIEVPGAGHVMSWNADPESYGRELRGFLESI